MQGSVRCSTTDKPHPARQASFWSMKWLGTGMVNPWSLPFSRCSPFSLSLSLSFFLSSSTCRLIRFEFLVLVLGLGHSFYSPIFAFRCLLVKMIFCSSVLLCALIESSLSSAAERHKKINEVETKRESCGVISAPSH